MLECYHAHITPHAYKLEMRDESWTARRRKSRKERGKNRDNPSPTGENISQNRRPMPYATLERSQFMLKGKVEEHIREVREIVGKCSVDERGNVLDARMLAERVIIERSEKSGMRDRRVFWYKRRRTRSRD